MTPFNILFIEDDDIDALFIQRLIRNHNNFCTYKIAKSFDEARNIIGNDSFDIIISDNHLSDGYLTDHVHYLNHIPFIISSGQDQSDLEIIAKQLGAVGYLTKPIDKNELIRKVKEVLDENSNRVLEENQSEVFDVDDLNEITGGDDSYANEMIEIMISKFPNDIAKMNHSLVNGDKSNLESIAHNLKSSFNIFKRTSLAECCKEIESLAQKENQSSQLNELISKLEISGSQFISDLNKLRSESDKKKIEY